MELIGGCAVTLLRPGRLVRMALTREVYYLLLYVIADPPGSEQRWRLLNLSDGNLGFDYSRALGDTALYDLLEELA